MVFRHTHHNTGVDNSNDALRAFDGMSLSEIPNTHLLKRHKRDAEFDKCLSDKIPDGKFNFTTYLNCLEDFQKREEDPCVRESELEILEYEKRKNKHGFFSELYKWFGLK